MEKYIDMKNCIRDSKIREIADTIKTGGVVVFPTETVYGIGVNGLDSNAIKKLFQIKQRSFNKPISLLVSSKEMIKQVACHISELEYKLIDAFFPGPLTLVLDKTAVVPDILTAGLPTVGIRMPENKIARKLVQFVGSPIATTSANMADYPSQTNLHDLMKISNFQNSVDCWVDAGESKLGIASTVVQVRDGTPYILREGCISMEHIKKVLNQT